MEVVNARAALLSNYEVLTLLNQLESNHLLQAKSVVRVKREEEITGQTDNTFIEPSENLRTVEIEAIQYLSSDYLSTCRESPQGIKQLVKDLEPYNLSKAEKLQIVNLAPTQPVELYVIVEELEDRLGNRMSEILKLVQSRLSSAPSSLYVDAPSIYPSEQRVDHTSVLTYSEENGIYHGDIVFDDTGQGVGVEGDLEVEDE